MDLKDAKGNSARTLHKIKEEKFKQKSELLERERAIDTESVARVLDLFWEAHFLRRPSSSGGVEPFDPQRIKTHLELSGQRISVWEYKLVMDMDLIFRSVALKKRGE